jgi:Tol biopolymer transport system component
MTHFVYFSEGMIMTNRTHLIRYLLALLALMIALAACSGGGDTTPASTPEPTAEQTTTVAMLPTEEPTSEPSPIPGQRRGDNDSDGDGIEDQFDVCPTDGDYGYGIDAMGCPNDSDKDGYPDHQDACPNEADLGYGINPDGCPIRDSDGDGVVDDTDACPNEADLGYGINPDGCPIRDSDGDGVVDDTDACPNEADLGYGINPDGCPIRDSDGDGVVDDTDACPNEGDTHGLGVDVDGCPIQPQPTPDVTPLVSGDINARPTINMGIEAYCQYFYTQPTAVFRLINPNTIDINASYTDQNGNVIMVNIPPGGDLYQYVTPNENGFASIQFNGVTNYAQVTNCFTAQLSVINTTCDAGMVTFTVFNSGPGTVQRAITWQLFGAQTTSGSFDQFGDEMTPNEQFDISGMADADGFLRFVVADYNFSFTNDTPCLIGEPTPEATPTEEFTPEATPTEEFTPEATPEMTLEVTPELTPVVTPTEEFTPEVTPEATETPNQLTLPEPPAFSIDSITCPTLGTLTITYTNGDFGAYSDALTPVLNQIIPQGVDLSSGLSQIMLGFSSSPVIITHTSPGSISDTSNMVATSLTGIQITPGTYTITIPLTQSGMPIINPPPAGAPLYLNVITPRQLAVFFNTILQPLVDLYNNGVTITTDDLQQALSGMMSANNFVQSLIYSQQLEQSLLDDCLQIIEPNLQITITDQCNAETGINTISFTITGADAIHNAVQSLGNIATSFPLIYFINGQQAVLPFQDGVHTVDVDTNNVGILSVNYINPAYYNAFVNSLLNPTTNPMPSDIPPMLTQILTVCGNTTNITIPEPPTMSIESITCPAGGQITLTMNIADDTTYVAGVQMLLTTLFTAAGVSGQTPYDVPMLISGINSMITSIPIVITHTTPLDPNALMGGGLPSNLVGYGTVSGNTGTTRTYTLTMVMPPPTGARLYATFINPYLILDAVVDAVMPLFERVQNGEQITMTDLQNALSFLTSGNLPDLVLRMLVNQELSPELVGECIPVYEPFIMTISEQCDANTSRISITMSGANYLASMGDSQIPVFINDIPYTLNLQDGTQTIAIDTTGMTTLQMRYYNPDYVNAAVEAMANNSQPPSDIPMMLTRDLTVCSVVVTPTEEFTPVVTPTEEFTPVVTPTEEFTPVVTPTEEFTPVVTPTEEFTPVVTPTEEFTPVVTPTEEFTPEMTPIVTIEIPTLPTLPTLPPLPTLPTPDAPIDVPCGFTTIIGGQVVIDLSGAGCDPQTERPVQNWQPITIGGAVCLPEIIYHTDETGDWELFWASDSRAPENLSDGVGTIDLAPTRSPDGQWIAFASNRDGNWELYAATVDGRIVVRLTDNDSAVDFDPSWSPDGTKIVYESNLDGNWELRMIDLLTGEKTRLTNHPAPDINPTWSPDGTTIAFQSSREDGLWQIYLMDIATGAITRLSDGTGDDINPQYHPDGNAILYQSGDALMVMDTTGNRLPEIPVMGMRVANAIWSPDGAYIAYQAMPELGFANLYVYEIATNTTRQITTNGNAFSPAWICDTTNIVFTSNVLGNNNLYVLNALPMDAPPHDLAVLTPNIGGDANQRDPQNTPSEEDASRGGNLPPK